MTKISVVVLPISLMVTKPQPAVIITIIMTWSISDLDSNQDPNNSLDTQCCTLIMTVSALDTTPFLSGF